MARFSSLAEDIGVDFPDLAPETVERLDALIPEFGTVGNPLDVTGQAFLIPGCMEGSLHAMAEDPNIHTMIYGQAYPTVMDIATEAGKAFANLYERYPDKNFFVSSLVTGKIQAGARFGVLPEQPVQALNGIPFLQGTENTPPGGQVAQRLRRVPAPSAKHRAKSLARRVLLPTRPVRLSGLRTANRWSSARPNNCSTFMASRRH